MQICRLRILLSLLLLYLSYYDGINDATHYYDFKIDYVDYAVGCATKEIVAINGKSLGSTICLRKGDCVIIKAYSTWAHGPAYVTQCPIQTGQSYVYKFFVPDQQGTLFYNVHIAWGNGGMLILRRLKGRQAYED